MTFNPQIIFMIDRLIIIFINSHKVVKNAESDIFKLLYFSVKTRGVFTYCHKWREKAENPDI